MGRPRYNVRMARPKKFARRIMVRFPDETLAAIQSIIGQNEDRSDFIRAAVELATAIRKIDVYHDLKAHLMANETIEDFCAKAYTKPFAAAKRRSPETRATARPTRPQTELVGRTARLLLRRGLVARPAPRRSARVGGLPRVVLIVHADRPEIAHLV